MTKCVHKEDIKFFCMSPDCQLSCAGGCSKCFTSEHVHADKQEVIEIDEIYKLMNKYSFPNKVKPECVPMQQSFFTFFKKTQSQMKQIITTIDDICKNVVNTIGYPYISFKNLFTVYKRIKNKEFNRISAAQIQKFVNETRATPILKLAEMEEKLYLKYVNSCHEMIKQIDQILSNFENLTKFYDQKVRFLHDPAPYLQNKELVEQIKSQLKTSISKNQSSLQVGQKIRALDKSKKSVSECEPNIRMISSAVHTNSTCEYTEVSKENLLLSLKTPTKPTSEQKQSRQQIQNDKKLATDSWMQRQTKRRVSLDNKLASNKEKLSQKVQQLKKSNKLVQNNDSEDNNKNDYLSKEKLIKNINLPAAEQKKKSDKSNCDIEIVPVTRRLEERLYEQQTIDQVFSPILKNKFREQSKKSRKSSDQKSERGNPQQNESGEKVQKSNQFELKMSKIKQSLPQLNQSQQKSFVILIASLKLKAAEAIPMIEKAIEQCSKNLSAAQYLSFLYLECNEYQKCLKLCDVYLGMIENNKSLKQSVTLFINNKASSLNNLGRYSQTVKLLDNYTPPNQLIVKNLANAYYGLGFLDQAILLYQKLLPQFSDDETYYNLSGCLFLIKQYAAANTAIHEAMKLQPTSKQYQQLQAHIAGAIKNSTNED